MGDHPPGGTRPIPSWNLGPLQCAKNRFIDMSSDAILPHRVEAEGYPYAHGGRRDGPPIWAHL